MEGFRARLALGLLLALTLAGCGGGDGNSGSVPSGSAPQSSATAEEDKGGEASIEEFGSEAQGSEKAAILSVFTGYLDALAKEDYEGACAALSASVHASLEQLGGEGSRAPGCASILPKLLAPTAPRVARQQANGRITKVRVEGDRAFVVFKAPGAKLYQLTMVREGEEWKAATVASAVLVPELR